MYLTFSLLSTLFLFSAFSAGYAASSSPSFDCSRASNTLEKAICNDSELSQLDREMANLFEAYKGHSTNEKGRKLIIDSQIQWIVRRSSLCADINTVHSCLKRTYEERISFLKSRITPKRQGNGAIDNKRIISKACEVERYLGYDEHTACLDAQKGELDSSPFVAKVRAIPENELLTLKQLCKETEATGIHDYYGCLYRQSSGYKSSAQASLSEKPELKPDDAITALAMQWPAWNPLPLTMQFGQDLEPKTPAQVFQEAAPSIYKIAAAPSLEHMKQEKDIALGSAVAVSNNQLITNCHIVDGRPAVMVMRDEYINLAVLRSSNSDRDTCILEVVEKTLTPIKRIRGYKFLSAGERVYTIGSPEGLENSISEGIISGLRGDSESMRLIQTSAAISHGSSGGALFDEAGNLIGITTLMITSGQALNFAVAIDEFFRE